jgi:bacterioferritin B
MPSPAFVGLVNEQIGHELAAQHQYLAIAIHFDAETLPRLRDWFYRQAVEERNHGMMLVQYLLDAGEQPKIPPVPAPHSDFQDIVAPIDLALRQERGVTEQFNALMGQARQDGDFTSEQFLTWFLKEQIEEVASMSDLLAIAKRAKDNPLWIEEYLGREGDGAQDDDPTAPPAAGGML